MHLSFDQRNQSQLSTITLKFETLKQVRQVRFVCVFILMFSPYSMSLFHPNDQKRLFTLQMPLLVHARGKMRQHANNS